MAPLWQQKPYLKSQGMGITATDIDARAEGLKAPFPYFGGKRRVAPLVWSRFGDVDTYNEPFAGSLAVLLGRPHPPRVETVNDIDCYLANFWRALQADPDGVARYCDWPVNEADLHARHRWLVEVARPTAQRCMTEPEFYDVKIAGYWVYGACLWIGSGWCQSQNITKRPAINGSGDSGGVHRRRWQGGGQGGGSGVHAPRGKQQKLLRAEEGGTSSGTGVTSGLLVASGGLYDYLSALSARLRRVRICCGDWKRILTPSVTTYVGLCGVLLDPPYAHDLRERCYSEDHDISADVRTWALKHGDDPKMRIALCGYEDEHGPHMPDTWEKVAWKAQGGYSRTERGVANREQERIWFSPHCLKGSLPLFADIEASA